MLHTQLGTLRSPARNLDSLRVPRQCEAYRPLCESGSEMRTLTKFIVLIGVVLLASSGIGFAQFSSTTQLVVETVTVNDKNGNPVENLTINDFTITEDGTPQAIRFFEFQKLPEIPDAPIPSGTAINALPY